MRRFGFALIVVLAVGVVACKSTPDDGYAIDFRLSFDSSVSDSALAQASTLRLDVSGAEMFKTDVALGGKLDGRSGGLRYKPGAQSGQLIFNFIASSISGPFAAGGATVVLKSGTQVVDVTLSAVTPSGDGGMLDSGPLDAKAPDDLAGLDLIQSPGRLFVFGGYDGTNVLGDSWSYDGAMWTQTAPGLAPSARLAAVVAYDSSRRRIVLFGGLGTGNTSLDDTWEYDGTTWARVNVSASPPAREFSMMAYDSARMRIVLFGGMVTGNTSLNDTWEYDGTNWTERNPANSPPARFSATMAYDELLRRTVLFGGDPGDTWEYDGVNWTQANPSSAPSSRLGASMVYDSARKRIVLFGGVHAATFLNDTWEYDGTNWTQVAATSPPVRDFASMIFDSRRARTVLFGGINSSYLDDTWEYDGSNWTKVNTPTSPPARDRASAEYLP